MSDLDDFLKSCTTGDVRKVCEILKNKSFDPSVENNRAIRVAAYHGQLAVVNLLLQDERVDPSVDGNCALRWAAGRGFTEVVDRLLNDARVNPSDKEEIVKLAMRIHDGKIVYKSY